MSSSTTDPLRRAAELVAGSHGSDVDALERRLKRDAFDSIGRIKPDRVKGVDFEKSALGGDFFADLPPPLQGIAIARSEGMLAFYNRIGWHPALLDEPYEPHVPEAGIQPLAERYHARSLHDLAYVHPKHFEKMLGKAGAAALWENLGRLTRRLKGEKNDDAADTPADSGE